MRTFTKVTSRLFEPLAISPNDRMHVSLTKEADAFVVDMWQDAYLGKTYPSYAAQRQLPVRIPERRQLSGEICKWQFAATDITAAVLTSLWPPEQVTYDDDALIVVRYLLASIKAQERNADIAAEYASVKAVPAHDFELREDMPLALYQQVALFNSCQSEGYGLFMEQGTGKTPIPITRICHECKSLDRMYRAIIVCPKNVRLNWHREFEAFATEIGKVTVLRGGNLKRTKQLIDAFTDEEDCRYTVVIVSYETLCMSWAALSMIEWDLAVLDESHFIKSQSTRRWKHAAKLRDRSARRMVLTGTPIANTPLDLYTQLEFLGKGWSGFNSWEHFKRFYGVFKKTASGHEALVGMQNLPFMQERLARLSFIIRKEEALPDLPEKVYDVYEVEMTPEQEELYEKIRDQLAIEIESDLEDETKNKALVVNSVLTKLLRLAQVTSGFVTWDAQNDFDGGEIQPKQVERLSPNPKIDAIKEILSEKGPNDKTIIWACWVSDILAIKEAVERDLMMPCVTFYGATSDREREEAEYLFNNDPKVRVLIGNPAAGGVGLNLLGHPKDAASCQTNCNHEIYFSQGWSSTVRSQSEDRAHRRGTRENVRITDLCVPETIDEEIRARVMKKRNVALMVSDLREILKSVLRSRENV